MATLGTVFNLQGGLASAAGEAITLTTHDSATQGGSGLDISPADNGGAEAATPSALKTLLAAWPWTIVLKLAGPPSGLPASYSLLAGITEDDTSVEEHPLSIVHKANGHLGAYINDSAGPQFWDPGVDITAISSGDCIFLIAGGSDGSIAYYIGASATPAAVYGGGIGTGPIMGATSRIFAGQPSAVSSAGASTDCVIEAFAVYAGELNDSERAAINADPSTMWGGGATTLDQFGYRFYADDDVEGENTPLEAENTPATLERGVPFRLRVGVDATGDPDAKSMQLEYRRVGDTPWKKV